MHPPKIKTHIYHISPPPADVDKLTKIFVNMNGVNPLDFEGSGNFTLSQKEFYLRLFTHKKADPTNANLIFFLTDFEKKNKKVWIEDLSKTYVMGVSSGN